MANKNSAVVFGGNLIVVPIPDNMKVTIATTFALIYTCSVVQARVNDVYAEVNTSEFRFPKDVGTNLNPRIIGGTSVAPHSYPFQAVVQAMYSGSLAFCGGTLISTEWVLTAAHCIDSNPTSIMVVLGAHNLSDPTEPNRQVFSTNTYKLHHRWNETTLQNDVALIKLPQNATLNPYVGTVRLASGSDKFEGMLGTTLGWGRTETSNASSTLLSVEQPILSNTACRAVGAYNQIIISSHLCVSGIGPRGSCSGDSGGPLLVNGIQVGIVSFGPENCTLSLPSVFTRVSEFDRWIQRAMSGATNLKICHIVVILVLAAFWFIRCNFSFGSVLVHVITKYLIFLIDHSQML